MCIGRAGAFALAVSRQVDCKAEGIRVKHVLGPLKGDGIPQKSEPKIWRDTSHN